VDANFRIKGGSAINAIFIGEDIFQNFNVVLNYQDSILGLGGPFIDPAIIPYTSPFPIWALILIIASGIIIGGLAVFWFTKKRRENLRKDLERYDTL